jgi:alpha,alpha-trehalase
MSPQSLYGELFHETQFANLFSDGKVFADAIPLFQPEQIRQQYADEKGRPGFDIKTFVLRHFDIQAQVNGTSASLSQSKRAPILTRIQDLWQELTREAKSASGPWDTLRALPHPFVVPGGRFREQYYWDSLFTMQGLALQGETSMVQGMLQNFAFQLREFGHIANSNRSYMATRSQPPLFYDMVGRFAAPSPEEGWACYLPELRAEHSFWMNGAEHLMPGQAHRRVVRLKSGHILNRYWDDSELPRDESYREDVSLAMACAHRSSAELYRDLRAGAESGWDFSSRWCLDPSDLTTIQTTAIVPVDLNAWLFGLERAIVGGAQHLKNHALAMKYEAQSAARWQALCSSLWNPQLGAYTDLEWRSEQHRPGLYAASVVPLYVGLASGAEAASMARLVGEQLLAPHGLRTSKIASTQQWDEPNGWAPLQMMAVEGLSRYGFKDLARELATRWLRTVEQVYDQTGRLLEKYDIEQLRPGGGGEYLTQDGFGWTNASVVVLHHWLANNSR